MFSHASKHSLILFFTHTHSYFVVGYGLEPMILFATSVDPNKWQRELWRLCKNYGNNDPMLGSSYSPSCLRNMPPPMSWMPLMLPFSVWQIPHPKHSFIIAATSLECQKRRRQLPLPPPFLGSMPVDWPMMAFIPTEKDHGHGPGPWWITCVDCIKNSIIIRNAYIIIWREREKEKGAGADSLTDWHSVPFCSLSERAWTRKAKATAWGRSFGFTITKFAIFFHSFFFERHSLGESRLVAERMEWLFWGQRIILFLRCPIFWVWLESGPGNENCIIFLNINKTNDDDTTLSCKSKLKKPVTLPTN